MGMTASDSFAAARASAVPPFVQATLAALTFALLLLLQLVLLLIARMAFTAFGVSKGAAAFAFTAVQVTYADLAFALLLM